VPSGIAAKPPDAARLTKMLMKRPVAEAVAGQIQEEITHFDRLLRSPEAAEAFRAFSRTTQPSGLRADGTH